MPDELAQAVTRLRAFRASWNHDDLICEDSRLSAADLDVLLERLEREQEHR